MKTKKGKQYKARIKDAKRFLHFKNYTKYRAFMSRPKHKQDKIKGREEWIKFCKTFFGVIAEDLVNNEAGVLLRKLGYFYMHMIPRKGTFYDYKAKGDGYNLHTDNYMYAPVFVPSRRGRRHLFLLSMDSSFNFNIKEALRDNIRAGRRYKSYVYSLKKLYR